MKLSLLHKVRPCWDALGQIWGHDVPSKEQREEYYIVCPPWGPDSIVHARRCSWAHVKPSKLDQVVACHMRNEPNDVHGCRVSEMQGMQCLWLNSCARPVS